MLDNEPTEVNGPGGDTTREETRSPVTRRRAASRPAGPPPEEPEPVPAITKSMAQAAAGTSPEPAAEPSPPAGSEPAASEPAGNRLPKRTRRRAAATEGEPRGAVV